MEYAASSWIFDRDDIERRPVPEHVRERMRARSAVQDATAALMAEPECPYKWAEYRNAAARLDIAEGYTAPTERRND